jgi:uncharacterized protein YbjT (DUF2867 family)
MAPDGKVLVIGGTGKVGQLVIKYLRSQEIPVRVLVRNMESVSRGDKANAAPATDFFTDKVGRTPLLVADPDIEVVQGSIADKEAVCRAVKGVSAVIDVHGVAPLRFSRISDLWNDPLVDPSHPAAVNFCGVQNVVAACQQHGVERLVRLTGLSVAMPASSPIVWLFNALLSWTVRWHRRSEIFIRDSGLRYTVVQPGGLRDTPPASESGDSLLLQCEAAAVQPTLPAKNGISRADVASLCVAALGCKGCENTTLRCVGLPKGQPAPNGVVSASTWQSLLEKVQPDSVALKDQNYVMYSAIGLTIVASVLLGIALGTGKLLLHGFDTLLR